MRISSILLALALVSIPSRVLAQYKFTLETTDQSPHKVPLFGDFSYPYILIDQDHFDCNTLQSCKWVVEEPAKDFYLSTEYEYKEALVEFQFDRFEKEEKEKFKVSLHVRINNLANAFGMNDLSFFREDFGEDYEVQVNLKDLTIKIGKVQNSKGKLISIICLIIKKLIL